MRESILLRADERGSIASAVSILRSGEVVAFPTDTVYGIGADSQSASAIERLYAIKGRERQKGIPLLLSRIEDMNLVARRVPEIAWELGKRFWPGALTLVLPKADDVLDILTAGASVAVRVPDHSVTLTLIASFGSPLATTSANLSGQREAQTAEEVKDVLGERVSLILDGGRSPGGLASSVVDLTGAKPVVLRRGALIKEVEAFLARTRPSNGEV